uniref:Uncharacterized protein n=1 Tax=Nelumbo nucifera TaxID=4432 RepID=A0A822ZU82_NELNU|nr:TPA_asm: hypothetical protein HUJ06_003678 [Nelumbo nucifera]
MSSCSCGRPVILARAVNRNYLIEHRKIRIDMGMMPYRSSGGNSGRLMTHGDFGVRASIVDSYESSSNFAKRMEQAWLISQVFLPLYGLNYKELICQL